MARATLATIDGAELVRLACGGSDELLTPDAAVELAERLCSLVNAVRHTDGSFVYVGERIDGKEVRR